MNAATKDTKEREECSKKNDQHTYTSRRPCPTRQHQPQCDLSLSSNDLVPAEAYHNQSCPKTKECAMQRNGMVATATQVCETFVHGAAQEHSACKSERWQEPAHKLETAGCAPWSFARNRFDRHQPHAHFRHNSRRNQTAHHGRRAGIELSAEHHRPLLAATANIFSRSAGAGVERRVFFAGAERD